MNNIHMSDEDNKHDTNYINKHKDANHDTRKLHLWARHVERAVSVFLDVCVTHTSWLKMSLSLHSIRMPSMSVSPWPLLPTFLLQPSRLLPLFCPDAPWAAHRPRQREHRATQPVATPRRGVTTPTTSPSPSQAMRPTTRSSTSSATPRVLSPTLHRHRTWT